MTKSRKNPPDLSPVGFYNLARKSLFLFFLCELTANLCASAFIFRIGCYKNFFLLCSCSRPFVQKITKMRLIFGILKGSENCLVIGYFDYTMLRQAFNALKILLLASSRSTDPLNVSMDLRFVPANALP